MAQNETDILRYLNSTPFGSARVSSMAGSFGALGGDLTTASMNPAGIAIFRKQEISLSAGFEFNNVLSTAEGESQKDTKNKFVFSNIGYVHSSAKSSDNNFYFNYAIGYNKTMDFNRNSAVSFTNSSSSMLFSFTDRAYGIPENELINYDPFSSYLAYETYLIDPQMDTPVYYTTQPLYEDSFNGVVQNNRLSESGSGGEMFLNMAIAIGEKVYLGGTFSGIIGNYEAKSSFIESSTVDSLLLNKFTFNYNQKSSFSGGDIKLGLIIKPEAWLRIGLAWHIPHFLNIEDVFSTDLNSQWKDGDFFSQASPEGTINYDIRNPGKWLFSLALVKGTLGLINIDLQWLNYSKAQFSSQDFDFSEENASIKKELRSAITARIGAEIWFGRYNLRAGYALQQDPNANDANRVKDFYNTYSFGAGLISDNNFFVNVSFNSREGGSSYYPYSKEIAPRISDLSKINEVLLSLGVRF